MFARMLAAIAAVCVLAGVSTVATAQEKKIVIMKSIAENHPSCDREIENELLVLPDRVSLRALGANSSRFTYEAPIDANGAFDKEIRNPNSNLYRLQGNLKARQVRLSLLSGIRCHICHCTWTGSF